MATRSKPFDTFGPYILFKRLEEHALGEVWRAGRVLGNEIRPVALHRLAGGNSETLRQAVQLARSSTSQIVGTSVVRNQILDVIDGVPALEHEYGGGRTLRHIVVKAKGGAVPHPIPVEQALAIGEKVAASVELVHNFRRDGARAIHGALIPHLVWVESDGETQTAGQQLGKGLIASLSNPTVAREIGPYIAPEVRSFGEPSAAGDIYAIGAILFLVLTGEDPPDAGNAAAFADAFSRAKLMTGEVIPPEIRSILQKALSPDINSRYGTASDLRKELATLLHGAKYAPTTFNLAFYLHSLLKKEFEGETLERERELKVNPAMYAPPPSASFPPPASLAPAAAASTPARRRPLIAAALFALIALGAFGAWVVIGRGKGEPIEAAAAQGAPVSRRPEVKPQVVTAVGSDSPEIAAPAVDTEEERRKRIEEEIDRRVQAQMMDLQEQYDREVAKKRADARRAPELSASGADFIRRDVEPVRNEPVRNEPVRPEPPAVETPVSPPPATTTMMAAQTQPPPQVMTQTQPPVVSTPVPVVQEPAPAPIVEQIREGDLVGINQVDQAPTPRTPIRPVYPPIALRQKLEATIYVTALISETGKVTDVKVLRGDSRRAGFDEAATRAIRNASFHPAIKNGVRVKTWFPIPIRFAP